MNPTPSVSLILATSRMPAHLALNLAALARQTLADYELLVADDGSGPDTAALIAAHRAGPAAGRRVEHLWQEHRGFRKGRVLNQAASRARATTLVFLDDDCVPHRAFLADHAREQRPGFYCAGRRVDVGRELSATLTPARVTAGFFDRPRPALVWSAVRGGTQAVNRSLRVPSPLLRRALGMDRVADLKGCNFSLARADFERVNGFDEEYEGYGREDTDLEIRLQNSGLRIRSLKGLALQFHVWHERRAFTPANEDRLERARRERRVACERGLSGH